MNDNNTVGRGVTFTEILALVLIVLKLTHIINWSWWWVLAPLWVQLIIAVIVLIIYHFVTRKDDMSYLERIEKRGRR